MSAMVPLATDWATISSLATAGGTLVLALATFASVRASSRSARIAEQALQEQRRPVLAPSRLDDPVQKTMFLDGRWVRAEGGRATVEQSDGIVYLTISLRNVGSGMAVCQSWVARVGLTSPQNLQSHAPLEDFHLQSRDLYIPPGDIGLWQGALRNPDDPARAQVSHAIETAEFISVELLYSDQVGRQRTITRFGLVPARDVWLATATRHWYLDWEGPRPESDALAAAEAVFRDQEAATERRAAAEPEAVVADADPAADADRSADPDPAVDTGPAADTGSTRPLRG